VTAVCNQISAAALTAARAQDAKRSGHSSCAAFMKRKEIPSHVMYVAYVISQLILAHIPNLNTRETSEY
jgi:hypothetical protein